MKPVIMDAELAGSEQYTGNPNEIPMFGQVPEGMFQQDQQQQQGAPEYFQQHNELKLVQEYNNEDLAPNKLKGEFWGLFSKSLKLGFWDKEDEQDIFYHKNIIRVGYIMSKPKHRYTFKERQQLNMIDFLVYADFKRGIGMERYKINERTLQATTVTQSIQGGAGNSGKKGGMVAALKGFFS